MKKKNHCHSLSPYTAIQFNAYKVRISYQSAAFITRFSIFSLHSSDIVAKGRYLPQILGAEDDLVQWQQSQSATYTTYIAWCTTCFVFGDLGAGQGAGILILWIEVGNDCKFEKKRCYE